MFGPIEKRLLWSIVLLAWLGMMIGEVLKYMSTRLPARPNISSFATMGAKVNRAKQLETAFASIDSIKLRPARNLENPFYPNPTQPPPQPPAPPTRSVECTYQGSFTDSQGQKWAFVSVADQLSVKTIGARVIADFAITDIGQGGLSLKDSYGKVGVLPFKTKKPVTIPAQ